MERSDAEVVQAVLGGDQAAYAVLYDRYAPVVRAICHDVTHSLNSAQDLSQEVFLKAYCKLDTLRNPERFSAWLVGISRNECREWIRRRFRDRHEYVDCVPEVIAGGLPDDDSGEAVLRAMQLLPERERLALHAFYLQNETADSIRSVLGLSNSAVYALLDRARRRLGELLAAQREGVR